MLLNGIFFSFDREIVFRFYNSKHNQWASIYVQSNGNRLWFWYINSTNIWTISLNGNNNLLCNFWLVSPLPFGKCSNCFYYTSFKTIVHTNWNLQEFTMRKTSAFRIELALQMLLLRWNLIKCSIVVRWASKWTYEYCLLLFYLHNWKSQQRFRHEFVTVFFPSTQWTLIHYLKIN